MCIMRRLPGSRSGAFCARLRRGDMSVPEVKNERSRGRRYRPRSRRESAQVSDSGHGRHRRGRRRIDRGAVPVIVEAFGERTRSGPAHRSRSVQDRAGPDGDLLLAQAADLRRQAHAGDAGFAAAHDARAEGPEIRGIGAARVREKRGARAQARSARAHRHLHAPRLPAEVALHAGRCHGDGRTGRAASSAPATARSSIWPAACSKARRHR